MKSRYLNCSVFFSVVFLFSGLGWAHGIEVSKPDSKTRCQIGQVCPIQWEVKDVDTVRIQLRLSAEKKWITITEETKNIGRHEWSVPDTILPGTHRLLILSTKDKETHGVSEEFKISEKKPS